MSERKEPTHTVTQYSVEREVQKETIYHNERVTVGTWPDDEPSKRVWALSWVGQVAAREFKAIGIDELFAQAEAVVEWVEAVANPKGSDE